MAARNLSFVSINCGNVIDNLSHYKIVKTPQSPSFAATATATATTTTTTTTTRDSIVRLFGFQGQISMTLS
jgi:hypothetical protein